MIRELLHNRDNWDKTAVFDGAQALSYGRLAAKAAVVRRLLMEEGEKKTAIFLPNSGAYISAYFGTLMAGVQVFPLNVQLTRYEINSLLEQASVYTVITSAAFKMLFDEIRKTFSGSLRVIYMEELSEVCEGQIPDKLLPEKPFCVSQASGAQEPMLLLNTSGTTGKAKIVQLSERNLDYCVGAYINQMDYGKAPENEVRYAIAVPFSSAYGLLVMTACIRQSFPIVLLKEPFTLDGFYMAVQEKRITHYEGGVMAALLMDQTAGRPNPYDIGSLRYLGLAGSKISADILHRLSESFPSMEFWTGYGMTEASPLITKPYKRMPPDKFASVGTAIEGETLLVDTDVAKTNAPYTKGEIIVKGPNVMLGYYNDEAQTHEMIKDGFLYTGDIGYFDEEGYLYICGRRKNVIIVRGFNVYAEEVEACILNSRLAKECIVYGESDALGNETVCADVVADSSSVREEDIRAYLSAHLSGYKQPQRIRFRENIGKTATGKVRKV